MTTKEYIKREAAAAVRFSDCIREDGLLYVRLSDVTTHLKSSPAADVRPVVLCRDCKHYNANTELKCVHIFGLTEPDEDDFCSLGERRREKP